MTFLGDHTKNNNILKSSNLKVKSNFLLYNDFSPLKIKRCSINKKAATFLQRYHTERTNQLSYYLAGLIEGDGSIILRKGIKKRLHQKSYLLLVKKSLKCMKGYKVFLIQDQLIPKNRNM